MLGLHVNNDLSTLNFNIYLVISNKLKLQNEQAGDELGQAQLKLGLDFNSIDMN